MSSIATFIQLGVEAKMLTRDGVMIKELRSWWQKTNKPLFIVEIIVLFAIIIVIVLGYWLKWDWTGFNEHIGLNASQYQHTKNLWDWLQLLSAWLIPITIAVFSWRYTNQQSKTEQQIAAQRYQADREIATDNQQEAMLQTYLDRMSSLLLEKNLLTSQPEDEVRNVARTRTLTVLSQLDTKRKNQVLSFLREAKLVSLLFVEILFRIQPIIFRSISLF